MEREPGEPITTFGNLGKIERMQQPYNQEILEAAAVALQCSAADLLTVNPLIDSQVIDMMDLVKRKDKETLIAILKGLPDTGTGQH